MLMVLIVKSFHALFPVSGDIDPSFHAISHPVIIYIGDIFLFLGFQCIYAKL